MTVHVQLATRAVLSDVGEQNSMIAATRYFRHGAKLMFHPQLRTLVIMPLVINVLLFGGLLLWGLSQLERLDLWLNAWLPEWMGWLSSLLWPLAVTLMFLAIGMLFTLLGNWLAAPFNGLLAERCELLLRHQETVTMPGWQWSEVPRILWREWRKLLYYLPRALGVLLLSLLPVFGTLLAPLLWFALASWMAAIQYADYPFDNHRIPFATMRRALRQQPLESLTFGACATLLALVPLLNLLIMPWAVCAACCWWVERHLPQQQTAATPITPRPLPPPTVQ